MAVPGILTGPVTRRLPGAKLYLHLVRLSTVTRTPNDSSISHSRAEP